MELKLKLALVKKDIQFKDLQMQLEIAKMDIESAEERSRWAEERSKQAVLAAEERSRQSIETAEKETAERFRMYGCAAECQRYKKKLKDGAKMDNESNYGDNQEDG